MTRITNILSGVLLISLVTYSAQAQAPVSNWAGFYGGINGTVQASTSTVAGTNNYTTDAPIVEPSGGSTDGPPVLPVGGPTIAQTEPIADHRTKTSGGAGVRLGYNYQTGPVVIGAESDIAIAGFTTGAAGLGTGVAGPNEGYAKYTHGSVMGTVRARAGVAFDRLLVFGTGGLALSDLRHTLITNSGLVASRHQTTGWTGGGGLEYRIAPRISLAATGLYSDFGNSRLSAGNATTGFTTGAKTHFFTASIGINARF